MNNMSILSTERIQLNAVATDRTDAIRKGVCCPNTWMAC